MDNKKVIAGGAAIAVVGILSYLGYKVVQEVSKMNFDDVDWGNLDDAFNYRRGDKTHND